jgi:predicted enzyme related to lactoylglutathione lyase
LVNLSTHDADATAAAFEAKGGAILEPARDVPDRGRAAFVQDDQQAVLVITESSSGDPEEGEVPIGGWLWNELWTHDFDQALAFYGESFGYEAEVMSPRPYALLHQGGEPVAGMLEIAVPDIRPHWVPFVRVVDVNATVELARAMQANVIFPPDPEVRDGRVAVLQSPTGEPIVVQSYDFN